MNYNYCPACGQQGTVQQLDTTNYECDSCGWHHWNNAKGTVAIAFVKDGQVLVSERAIEPRKGMFDLPGGFVDFGETAEEAAIREIKEELGIDLQASQLELIGVYHNNYFADISTIDVTYQVTDWEGDFIASSDAAALVWKPFSFIDDPSFAPPYKGLSQTLIERNKA